MSVIQNGPFCSRCDRNRENDKGAASSPRIPCPDCGYTGLNYKVAVNSTGVGRASMAYKKRTQGNSKPTIEGKVGADYNRDGRRWFNMEQIVDRENDRYKKRLVDEETGQVIRDDDGKLSDHQGFGDAKPRKSPLEGKEEPET